MFILYRLIAATVLLAAIPTIPALAQTYPSRPVSVIVPFAPGQATDTLARFLSAGLSESLGKPFVVENRPGAGGRLGTAAVAKAAPDGYTLLMASIGPLALAPALYPDLPYSPMTDLALIANVALTSQVLVAAPSSSFRTLNDVVTQAKKTPGQINFASAGNGSNQHLTMELFMLATGIKMQHVPFKGGSESATSVMAGFTPIMFDSISAVLPYVKAGKLIALGIASAERSPYLPDLPTLAEQGIPGFSSVGWMGLAAPAGTPGPILDKINKAVQDLLNEPATRKQLATLAFTPAGDTRAAFASFVQAEQKKWADVISKAGVKLE